MATDATNNNGQMITSLPGAGIYTVDLYWLAYNSSGVLVQQGPEYTQQVTISPPNSSSIGLKAEYFNGNNFNTLVRTVASGETPDYDWGSAGPQGTGTDSFSIRWTGYIEPLYSQTYTFTTGSDDGMRVFVEDMNNPVAGAWSDHGYYEASGTKALVAGQRYEIKVEFFENGGGATARLFWESSSQSRQIVPVSRLFPPSAPPPTQAPSIVTHPADRTVNIGGTATFTVVANGSPTPAYQWRHNGAIISGATGSSYSITGVQSGHAGSYDVVVSNSSGVVNSNSATLTVNQNSAAGTGTGLRGDYYNGTTFGTITTTRVDSTVDFDWGNGSPGSGINSDNFLVRWSGRVEAPVTGYYTFSTNSDDGVRLKLSQSTIIEDWTQHGPTDRYSAQVYMTAGEKRDIVLEFFEAAGGATARLFWEYPGRSRAIVPADRLYPTPNPSGGSGWVSQIAGQNETLYFTEELDGDGNGTGNWTSSLVQVGLNVQGTGRLRIYTTGSADTIVSLFNFNWGPVQTNVDDGGIGGNAYFEVDVSGGSYRMLITGHHQSSDSENLLLYVDFKPSTQAPVVIVAQSPINIPQWSDFEYQIATQNSPETYDAVGLPPGLVVNTSNGRITGKPSQSGNFGVTLSATNSAGTGSASIGFNVTPVSAPDWTSVAGPTTANVNSTINYTFTAHDPDGDLAQMEVAWETPSGIVSAVYPWFAIGASSQQSVTRSISFTEGTGVYKLWTNVRDAGGRWRDPWQQGLAGEMLTVTVSNPAEPQTPTISIATNANGSKTITLNATYTPGPVTVTSFGLEYSLDGAPMIAVYAQNPTNTTLTHAFTVTAPGDHTILARCAVSENGGNTWRFSPQTALYSFNVAPPGTAPSITTHPTSQVATVGQPVTFSVGASGSAPLSYQWRKNGSDISGATNSSYSLTNVQMSHAGSYDVVVTNSVGNATSNAATLTVTVPTNGDITTGLIHWWKFDEVNGETAANSVGGAAGTLINGPMRVDGKVGSKALSFDGVDDYVDVPAFNWSGGAVTVAYWSFVPSGSAGMRSAFGVSDGSGSNRLQAHAPWSDGTLYWDCGSWSGNGRITTNYTAYIGKWTHVVLVSAGNGGNFKAIYLDGVLVSSAQASEAAAGLSGFRIGSLTEGGGSIFHAGSIDDFRIYNRALSQADVTMLVNYEDSGTGITAGLVNHWKFDEGGGATANDSVGGAHGGLVNGQGWTTGQVGTGALSFNSNANSYVAAPQGSDAAYTGALTIGAWVNITSFATSNTIASKVVNNGAQNSPFDFHVDSTGQLYFVRANSSYCNWKSVATVGSGWHHVAVVAPDGNVNTSPIFYIDGVVTGAVNLSINSTGPATGVGADIRIGRRHDGEGQFNGSIDDLRIYNRALAAADITELFNTGNGGGGTTNGLSAEYYDNIDFTNLKISRIDAKVDFGWGLNSPDASMNADTFSVRWTGQVQPRFSETYTFTTTSDDGVRLWVNNQLIIDNWTDHGDTPDSGTITLVANQKYAIRMEFYENGGGATARLAWASASQAYQIIPQTQLYRSGVPSFTTQPISKEVQVGNSVAFTVMATGNPVPTLQWRKNGQTLADGGNISGATTNTLTITSVTGIDVGAYDAVATNSAGSETSAAASLTVTSNPNDTDADGIPNGVEQLLGTNPQTGGTNDSSNDTLKLKIRKP